MASHLLAVGASQADRPVSIAANGEDHAVRYAVDKTVGAISRIAIVKWLGSNDSPNFQIDPTCERDAVLGNVD
jgi:hypothetical protein